jgi:hypothetical protein
MLTLGLWTSLAALSAGELPAPSSGPRVTVASNYFGNFGYPFMNTISGNTSERFKEALEMTKQRLLAKPGSPCILNINCWNEWTEGSYLEPGTVHGLKYLEAIRDVFYPARTENEAVGP